MILDSLVLVFVLTAIVGSVAIWASWNEINSNEWIANNVDGCPFKYKWQMADDLSTSRLGRGSKMDVKFTGTRIPTFEEALAVFPKNVWLNCHLKGGADLGAATAKVIAKTARTHQAFLAATADAAKAARAAVPDILICNMERQSSSMDYAQDTIAMKAQFIQLLGKGEVPVNAIKLLKDAGIRVNYYHDESPEGLRRQWQAGVDFPLVNDLAKAVTIAREFGIDAVK